MLCLQVVCVYLPRIDVLIVSVYVRISVKVVCVYVQLFTVYVYTGSVCAYARMCMFCHLFSILHLSCL